jgi:hypothetical protein
VGDDSDLPSGCLKARVTTLEGISHGQTDTVAGGAAITNSGDNVDAVLDLDDDGVTNAKLANMAQATIKGRASGAGTGDPVDLTAAQVTAILDVFTSGLKGLAPASGGGSVNFLRADGTWAAPGGGGFNSYEEEFTAVAGTQTFTLSATAAVNANMLSGRTILGVFRNGVRSRYQATATLANEWDLPAGNQVRVVGQSGGEIFTVVFGV